MPPTTRDGRLETSLGRAAAASRRPSSGGRRSDALGKRTVGMPPTLVAARRSESHTHKPARSRYVSCSPIMPSSSTRQAVGDFHQTRILTRSPRRSRTRSACGTSGSGKRALLSAYPSYWTAPEAMTLVRSAEGDARASEPRNAAIAVGRAHNETVAASTAVHRHALRLNELNQRALIVSCTPIHPGIERLLSGLGLQTTQELINP